MGTDHQAGATGKSSPDERLDSWTEISAYLKRTVRTVQRWERAQGLPVHRIVHDKRSTVFAYKSELDHWWASRQQPARGWPMNGAGAGDTNTNSHRGTFLFLAIFAGIVVALMLVRVFAGL